MAVALWAGSLLAWERELSTLKERVAGVLGRRELKETSGVFLDGLLPGIERKTGWLMAEQAGAERPYRMQSLLGRSRWDAEPLRDAVRAYAVEALADPDGVLIVDETGFLKKGEHSAGVARQYSGTAGRGEDGQIGVFPGHGRNQGHALVLRELHLPQEGGEVAGRRGAPGLPDQEDFGPQPGLGGR